MEISAQSLVWRDAEGGSAAEKPMRRHPECAGLCSADERHDWSGHMGVMTSTMRDEILGIPQVENGPDLEVPL